MDTALKRSYRINKQDFLRAGEASIQVKNTLKSLGVHHGIIRRVAICGYEGEMNVVMHGGEGEIRIEIHPDRIVLDIQDDGAGIADIELAMTKGYSTASEAFRELGFGAGMGLPNMKKNADRFWITSEKHVETRVHMVFWLDRCPGEEM